MYSDYLASRGYTRVLIERTEKRPGDLVLASATMQIERVPEETRVVPIRKRRRADG